MAVVYVEPIWSGRDGEFSDTWDRKYTQVYRVETDDTGDGPAVVGFADGIPPLWVGYASFDGTETDPLSVCRRKHCAQDEGNPFLWEVRCEYDTRATEPGTATGSGGGTGAPGQPGQGGGADEPDKRPWDIGITSDARAVPLRFQLANPAAALPGIGQPALNFAYDPFDPLPEVDAGEMTVAITRYDPKDFLTFDQLDDLAFSLNAETFLGRPPLTVRLLPIESKLVWFGNTAFWQRTYRFQFKQKGTYKHYSAFGDNAPEDKPIPWQPLVLNAGYRELKNGKAIGIYDGSGPVTVPKPLTATGQAMSVEDVTAGKSIFLRMDGYRVRRWKSAGDANNAGVNLNIEGPLVAAGIGFEAA